jgi:ribonuclease VapC
MTKIVLDASAVLAILLEEPGATIASARLPGALCTTVNLTEVITRCVDKAIPSEIPEQLMAMHNVQYVNFDVELALFASSLRLATRSRGLSLGDRACLALAIRENGTAITTDRAWADLDVGCKIEVIR